MRRVTTNHDLRRFRACAAVGLSIAETARQCGVPASVVRRWGLRLELRFARRRPQLGFRIDPMAEDKLMAMLARLRAARSI